MSTYKDRQTPINKFFNLKMETKSGTATDDCLSPCNASPPDIDFNLPYRFFKSSFARSLSLNHSSNNSSNQCKSLDYDLRSNNGNKNKFTCLNRDTTAASTVPPLPQRRLSQAGSFYQQNNEANNTCEQKQVIAKAAVVDDKEKPPALPARCPVNVTENISVNEYQKNEEQNIQQSVLTQLRQQVYKHSVNTNNNNDPIMTVNGNNNNKYTDHTMGLQVPPQQPTLNQKPYHFAASANKNVTGNNNSSCNSSSVNKNNNNNTNFRRNNIVWPNQQKNVEQDCNICNFDQVDENDTNGGDELNSNYINATKLSKKVNDYNNHFHNSHQMLHMLPTIDIHCNQQKQQQQQQQNQMQQQQQQQHLHMSSYEILNDNTTNVEAVILQNQVDTLQWQLKQVETSCEMYRAVMDEVARFLERYQSQKQLQQQQQQLQQQQMATQKHYNNNSNNNNNNNKMEQIQRSKSLFQVYTAGSNDKSTNDSNVLDETTRTTTSLSSASSTSTSTTTTSYLRARSSTNLIDLKHQQSNTNCSDKTKDDHNFETDLTPNQSYNGFKDFTWRRSPKKADSRLSIAKDDVEEKLNQEAFRLLRTIQNLLSTSQHQLDLINPRQSLAPTASLQMGRLSKAMSTASVTTLPGPPPMLNSTNLTTNINANSTGSTMPDPSNASPALTSGNNVASNNLAPEMLFLRSANMRDSRLSLRSSTDSSVHSTSSVASSGSSKVETDEEPSAQYHSPPTNLLTHKQQHHHITGSSTEDESGFSSISSFADIGMSSPLNSTLLSSSANSGSKNRFIGKELKSSLKANERVVLQTPENCNSTLKANVVGLPLNSSHDMSHRWDSPSKTYHNASNKFQRFCALTNEDSNAVLWV